MYTTIGSVAVFVLGVPACDVIAVRCLCMCWLVCAAHAVDLFQ